MQTDKQAQPATATTTEMSPLDQILTTVSVELPKEKLDLEKYADPKNLGMASDSERLVGGLSVLFAEVTKSSQKISKVDKELIDLFITEIDSKISAQIDVILHHEKFQQLEAAWRGLFFLVERTDFKKNVEINFVDVSKADIANDFEDAVELLQSGLFRKVYTEEYDQAGGKPYAALISNYEFANTAEDINLLNNISKIAAAAHCPFIGAAGAKFFGRASIDEVMKIPDLVAEFKKGQYFAWNSFRESDDSRYVGLVLPRFLLRLPYGPDTKKVKAFDYKEQVTGTDHERYLWGNAAFAFATNMVRSFVSYGWTVQIRGPEAGGMVENLPVHAFEVAGKTQTKIPTEALISDTDELALANLGFIPFINFKETAKACFFSANSSQKPAEYDSDYATANARISARLPYMFLVSRLAHYLKVIQRQNIGSIKSAKDLEDELSEWLNKLVTKAPDPDAQLVSRCPLRDFSLSVQPIEENPGYYRVAMAVMPHFQIEGIDISLSLVSKMKVEK